MGFKFLVKLGLPETQGAQVQVYEVMASWSSFDPEEESDLLKLL
jgi:hypothetical protein